MNSSINFVNKLKERSTTDYLIVHQSATTTRQRCDVFDIHRWHIERGWSGIGYHFVIEKDGVLRSGRPLNTVGAHCKGFNTNSVGICLVGGLDKDGNTEDNFSPKQYRTLQTLVILLKEFYPEAELVKHKDLAETECNEANLEKLNSHIR